MAVWTVKKTSPTEEETLMLPCLMLSFLFNIFLSLLVHNVVYLHRIKSDV